MPCLRLLDVSTGNVYENAVFGRSTQDGVPAVTWDGEMDGACSTTKEVRNAKAVRF